ncbi:MAG: DNA replication/repair protein RecF [Oscillospiraceae bacterium]|nr:DNA replication/repair protein RecF [Oscillospiraceae bacterium]
MRVDELSIQNFRNLADPVFRADPRINIIFGNNAQGKTNLMEALWLFTGNRSFRGAREAEMIAFGKQSARLQVNFECNGRDQTAQLMLGERKKNHLNQVPVKTVSEFAGRYYAVVFSPSDLSFVKDGPEKRRRFLDIAIAQIKPVYQKYLNQYNRVLIQRNALLKDLYNHPSLEATVDLWDEQLAKLGTILTGFRMDYLKKLNGFAGRIYEGIAGGAEQAEFLYRSTVFEEELNAGGYTDEAVGRYAGMLATQREEDKKLGSTSVGVHRDDIEVKINGFPARQYGSQGQQRSCVLALKLGESELLRHVTGESPVMLLDDVMSELDPSRQDYILNHLENQQVFLTCCDVSNTLRLKSGSIYRVEDGRISAEDSPPRYCD